MDWKALLGQAVAKAAEARAILAKAETAGRDMTAAEKADFQQRYDEAVELKARADKAKAENHDAQLVDQIKALDAQINGTGGEPRGSRRRSAWAHDTAEKILKALPGPDGSKAVVSGTISGVTNPVSTDVVPLGRVATTLLDLIPSMPADSPGMGGNTFTFLRETVRTNNAAPVADAGTKPTSVYTVQEIEDRFRVIAHLSEAIPQRYLTDFRMLEDFLRTEMEYGLRVALENQILNGAGTGETFTGLNSTSGILTQAAVTGDLIATLRKALTSLQTNGNAPSAGLGYVLNPTDMEKLDLLREGTGTGTYLLGSPAEPNDANLWRVPRVTSTAVTAGTAWLGNWDFAELVVREDAQVAIDTSGTNFTTNQAVMRVEGRYGWACKRPSAFVKITLP